VRVVVDPSIRADHGDLRRLVEAGFLGIDPSGVEVRVERSRRPAQSFAGRAYGDLPTRPRPTPGTLYLVRVWVPTLLRNRGYPRTYRYARRVTAPWITVGTWRERFVALVAHEACHLLQFRERLRRSEVAAERWAEGVLARWRIRAGEAEPGKETPAESPVQLMINFP
jgi:hypothetical protein